MFHSRLSKKKTKNKTLPKKPTVNALIKSVKFFLDSCTFSFSILQNCSYLRMTQIHSEKNKMLK